MSFCYINGFYKNNIDAQISVEDRGFNFSDGVYEVIGFRKGKLLNFNRHLNRLSKSLIGLQISKPFTNQNSLKIIINHLLKLNDINNGFFKPFGILVIEAKLPILLLLTADFFFLFKLAIYFTKISAAFMFTPIFSYVNLYFFIYLKYVY